MKLNTTDFLRKCQHPLLMALISIPVALIVVINAAPDLLNRMWALPAAFAVLSWGCLVLPGKRRLLGGIISAVLLIVLGALLLNVKEKLLLAALPVLYAALIFVTLPIGGWPRDRELNMAWYVAGICFYVLIQLLINGSRSLGADVYGAAAVPVVVCFLAFAGLLLLALNRASLDSAAMSRRTVPVLMRRQNLVITLVLLVIGILIAAVPAIGSMLNKLWDWVMQGMALLSALLMTLLPERSSQGGGPAAPGDMQMSFGEAQEPSALAVMLEKMLSVVVIVLLIIAIFFAGRALIRQLIRFAKYMWGRLGHYGAAASEDYEDEITDTRDEPGTERTSLLGRLRRMAPADDKGLSASERVRYRYKRLKQKRRDWSRASTARETLPEAAATLYERVRYGDEALTEEEASRFREDTRRV